MLDKICECRHRADTQAVPFLPDEGKIDVCQVDDTVNLSALTRLERGDQMCAAGKGEAPRTAVG